MSRLLRVWLLVASAGMLSPSVAQEYFGEFLDQLRGTFNVEAKPRPTFKIESDFRFKDPNGLEWRAPAGTTVDGASIPQPFWSIIGGPFEGTYINASVIHDHYCHTRERTAHDTHRNFFYGMRAAGVPEWKAALMHWVVATFGPSWTLTKRVVMEQSCSDPSLVQPRVCTSTPRVVIELAAAPAIDLSDPEVLAAAISKTDAVARTLLTSGGKVLDVTAQGQVSAKQIQASAEAYRRVFASKEFTSSSARLGLLSQVSGASLGDVRPWTGNRIPRLQDATVLTPNSSAVVKPDQPIKLDARSKGLLGPRIDLDKLGTATRVPANR